MPDLVYTQAAVWESRGGTAVTGPYRKGGVRVGDRLARRASRRQQQAQRGFWRARRCQLGADLAPRGPPSRL